MAAAAGYSLLKVVTNQALVSTLTQNLHTLLIGNVVAFLVATASIRFFIGFLTRHGFRAFGYYRIAVGLILFGLLFAGVDLNRP
jgi:undecaprenyl-diphosphatase